MEKVVYQIIIFFLFPILFIPTATFAGEIDGSKPLHGSLDKIIENNQFRTKEDVDPDTVGLPRKFIIDFKARLIQPSKDSLVRKTPKIRHIEHLENKLILQGVEDPPEVSSDRQM